MIITEKHPMIKLSTEFSELCKPLLHFKIHHFTYQKHLNDGRRIMLSNKPKWVEDYFNLNLLESSLYEGKPSNYTGGVNVWLGDYDLPVYRHGKNYYNTTHTIAIIEPTSDGCEFFLFATANEYTSYIHYLINHLDILYRFIAYLKDKGASLFAKAHNHKLQTAKEIIMPDAAENLIYNEELSRDLDYTKQKFLHETRISRYVIHDIEGNQAKLSLREIDFARLLLNHKTLKEISAVMNISIRTAESYMNNIKIKLNSSSKSNLIDKLKKSSFLNICL